MTEPPPPVPSMIRTSGNRSSFAMLVGPDGYFVANGFSGHGFKLGPAVGALIGRMMTGIELADDPPVNSRYFAADRRPIASGGGVLA